MKKILLTRRLLLSASAIMGAAAMQAQDTTYNWDGSAGSDFYAAENWTNPAGTGVFFDDAVFRIVRTNDQGTSPVIGQAWAWQPGIFDAQGGTLTVNAEFNCYFNDFLNGTIDINDGGNFTCRNIIRVGRAAQGVVNINSGGLLRANNTDTWQGIFIGVLAGGSGVVNVNDGGIINGGYQVEVGTRNDYPSGTLTVNTGGLSEAYWATVVGPNGVINVSGGTINCGERLLVGDLFLDPGGVAGPINGLTGLVNLNSGTIVVNHNDLVRADATYLVIHEDGKIVIDGGTLSVKSTGVDLSAAMETFITNEQIVTVEGKELVVNYDGVFTTVTAEEVAGIEGLAKNGFALYPNPTNGVMTVQPSNDFGGSLDVAVVNMLGKTVLQAQLNGSYTLDVNALASGIYMMSINNGVAITTQKFIKE